MAGRRPKPTEVKRQSGNPGRRPLNDNEPDTGSNIGEPPSYLSSKAKHAWSELSKTFSRMNVLQKSDRYALERLCETYAEVRELQEDINAHGRTIEVKSTQGDMVLKTNPAVRSLAEADKRFRSYLIEFGLTPASRSKINAGQKNNNEDPLNEFIK